MRNTIRPSLIIVVNVALVASVVLAQDPSGAATIPAADNAIGQILQTGVVGAIAILEGIVIWYLYRQVAAASKQFVDLAIKQTEITVKNNDLLSRNEEIQSKILDRLPRRNAGDAQ